MRTTMIGLGGQLFWDLVAPNFCAQAQSTRLAETLSGIMFSIQLRPDGNMSVPFVNGNLKELTGLEPDEVMRGANSLSEIVHPADWTRLSRSILKSARLLKPWREEFRFRGGTGAVTWVEGHALPQRQPDGTTVWHGLVHRAMDGRQAGRQTDEGHARYRHVFDAEPDAVLIVDTLTMRVLDSNPAANRLYGYTAEEFLQLTPFDLSKEPEKTRQVITDNINRVSLRWHLKKDGTPFPVEINCNFFELDGRKVHVAIIRDISARHAAEAALQASEEQFRAVVENAPQGIFVQSEGVFSYINPTGLALFGTESPESLVGTLVIDRIPEAQRAEVTNLVRQVNHERRILSGIERKYVRLDGSVFDAEVAAVPFCYKGKQGALVFFRDVTDRKNLEEQFRQAQKMEAVGQLAGGVAHDFNNILAATMMHLGVLRAHPAIDSMTKESLKELESHAQRAANLTRQLLLFGRRSVMQMQPVDLNELVVNLLKMLRRLLGEHIDVRFDAKNGLPLLNADPGMMEQVIMNLAVNARDAMPAGGCLTIATGLHEIQDDGNGSSPSTRRFVTLSVTDTGCGMDSATQRRIFEPFFTTKAVGHGTGLGLATVHGIVKQHQGGVDVQSQVGAGTTFRVFFPAQESPTTKPSVVPDNSPLPRGHETILLVEDEPAVRLTTARCLRLFGYRVIEAQNGKEALALWPQHRSAVDLLFTDMVMPEGTTGLQLARALRKDQPRLKVIISSGYSAEIAGSDGALDEGVVYLPKPCEPRKLAVSIRGSLDQFKVRVG